MVTLTGGSAGSESNLRNKFVKSVSVLPYGMAHATLVFNVIGLSENAKF